MKFKKCQKEPPSVPELRRGRTEHDGRCRWYGFEWSSADCVHHHAVYHCSVPGTDQG